LGATSLFVDKRHKRTANTERPHKDPQSSIVQVLKDKTIAIEKDSCLTRGC